MLPFIVHTAEDCSPPFQLGPRSSQWARYTDGLMKTNMVFRKGNKGERNLTMCPVWFMNSLIWKFKQSLGQHYVFLGKDGQSLGKNGYPPPILFLSLKRCPVIMGRGCGLCVATDVGWIGKVWLHTRFQQGSATEVISFQGTTWKWRTKTPMPLVLLSFIQHQFSKCGP